MRGTKIKESKDYNWRRFNKLAYLRSILTHEFKICIPNTGTDKRVRRAKDWNVGILYSVLVGKAFD